MRQKLLETIIRRDRGDESFHLYDSCQDASIEELADTIKNILDSIPPSFGSCVMVSAGLVAALKIVHGIHAIAVVGDLRVNGVDIFKCKSNIPIPSEEGEVICGKWDGHCWVELDGTIFDLSVFRSAYAVESPRILKDFMLSGFGEDKGAVVFPINSLPNGLEYTPKYVLNDVQISCLLGGLSAQSKGEIPVS